jgi:nitroreductase
MIFRMNQDNLEMKYEDYCITCGHCLAICPENAIRHEKLDYAQFYEFPTEKITPQNLYTIFQARRSIRNFQKRGIPRELLQELINETKHAPTATNRQNVKFLVLQEHAIPPFVTQVRDFYGQLLVMLQSSQIDDSTLKRRIRKWNHWMVEAEKGRDAIFYDPPAIIIVYAPRSDSLSYLNAGYAVCYLMLAAKANGLGTLNIGYAIEAIRRKPEIAKELGITDEFQIFAVMALGYPSLHYRRIPLRNPPSISWRD